MDREELQCRVCWFWFPVLHHFIRWLTQSAAMPADPSWYLYPVENTDATCRQWVVRTAHILTADRKGTFESHSQAYDVRPISKGIGSQYPVNLDNKICNMDIYIYIYYGSPWVIIRNVKTLPLCIIIDYWRRNHTLLISPDTTHRAPHQLCPTSWLRHISEQKPPAQTAHPF